MRDRVHCSATAAEVIDFLASGAGLPYRVKRLAGSPDILLFSTDPSAFSWGEKTEVTVAAHSNGSTIFMRGARAWSLNITSDPRTPVERILAALTMKFGPLTQE